MSHQQPSGSDAVVAAAVDRALARFHARRAELATTPEDREASCREATKALGSARAKEADLGLRHVDDRKEGGRHGQQ